MTEFRPDSPGFPVVIPQKTTEPPTTHHLPFSGADIFLRLDQSIAWPLMIPFSVIVSKELRNSAAEHRFTEENHTTETLFLDGPNEALEL